MNASPVNAHRPLIELLGARWEMEAPVAGLAWDAAGAIVGFALGDGTLALAHAAWVGGPRVQPRDGGGIELIPAVEAPRPVTRVRVHSKCLSIAADPAGGFLTGGDDGVLTATSADGVTAQLGRHTGGWADPVAAAPGLRACAVNRRVHITGDNAAEIELPSSVAAMAFDPAGRMLAIAHHGGLTVWSAENGQTRSLPRQGSHRAVAWSPDGRHVVSGTQEGALHGWRIVDGAAVAFGAGPGQPRSLSFGTGGRLLAAGGGPRPLCWRFDPPGGEPAECGIASAAPVGMVACHPAQGLIAAGYANGAVLLCQPGSDEVLFVRGSGGGPVSGLAWSADGGALAIGAQDGEIAIVSLPPALFRQEGAR